MDGFLSSKPVDFTLEAVQSDGIHQRQLSGPSSSFGASSSSASSAVALFDDPSEWEIVSGQPRSPHVRHTSAAVSMRRWRSLFTVRRVVLALLVVSAGLSMAYYVLWLPPVAPPVRPAWELPDVERPHRPLPPQHAQGCLNTVQGKSLVTDSTGNVGHHCTLVSETYARRLAYCSR